MIGGAVVFAILAVAFALLVVHLNTESSYGHPWFQIRAAFFGFCVCVGAAVALAVIA